MSRAASVHPLGELKVLSAAQVWAIDRAKYKSVVHQLNELASVAPALAGALDGEEGGAAARTTASGKARVGGLPPSADAAESKAAVRTISSQISRLFHPIKAEAAPETKPRKSSMDYNPVVCPNMDKSKEGNHPFLNIEADMLQKYDVSAQDLEETDPAVALLTLLRSHETDADDTVPDNNTGGAASQRRLSSTAWVDKEQTLKGGGGHKINTLSPRAKEKLKFSSTTVQLHTMVVGDNTQFNNCANYGCDTLMRPGDERWFCQDCLLSFCCGCASASMTTPDVLALSSTLRAPTENPVDTGAEEEHAAHAGRTRRFRTAGNAIMAGQQISSLFQKMLKRQLNPSDADTDSLSDLDALNFAVPMCTEQHAVAVQENTNRFSVCRACKKVLFPKLGRFYCKECISDYCSSCIHKSIADSDASADVIAVQKCCNVPWCCEVWTHKLLAGVSVTIGVILTLIIVIAIR